MANVHSLACPNEEHTWVLAACFCIRLCVVCCQGYMTFGEKPIKQLYLLPLVSILVLGVPQVSTMHTQTST